MDSAKDCESGEVATDPSIEKGDKNVLAPGTKIKENKPAQKDRKVFFAYPEINDEQICKMESTAPNLHKPQAQPEPCRFS